MRKPRFWRLNDSRNYSPFDTFVSQLNLHAFKSMQMKNKNENVKEKCSCWYKHVKHIFYFMFCINPERSWRLVLWQKKHLGSHREIKSLLYTNKHSFTFFPFLQRTNKPNVKTEKKKKKLCKCNIIMFQPQKRGNLELQIPW